MTDNNAVIRAERVNFEMIPHWLLEEAKNISTTAIVLYLMLKKFADYKTGECFPGRKRLASQMNVSVRTVGRALKELENVGAIKITHRRYKDKKENDTNLYFVCWNRFEAVDNLVEQIVNNSLGRAQVPQGVGHIRPTGRALVAQELKPNELKQVRRRSYQQDQKPTPMPQLDELSKAAINKPKNPMPKDLKAQLKKQGLIK
jgi:DNA-binding transcriptional regulator YhcF (GntR family)